MRRRQNISYTERVRENIRLIKEDEKLLDQIEERIEQRHRKRMKQIPS
ncbi:FbpB family small basic protein [Halobacillus naozhouensis]|uniref:FbpB family small basic protein n=1 Tax=Halobacillus naozhouensis TaxID=554880 RepID=A0ABY8IWN2_9BACI|nr:FbpB family small basic protein [Halobacillus naozhouensis]WFT72965.1 FbpB family small basic protein [Halobacillus naozhouensis]